MTALLIALAAAIGAVLRFTLDELVKARSGGAFPLGTVVVNVSGSLALGLLVGFASASDLPKPIVTALGPGLLGSYTTFSTWMLDSVRLAERRAFGRLLFNLGGSLVLGVAAAVLGLGIGRAVG